MKTVAIILAVLIVLGLALGTIGMATIGFDFDRLKSPENFTLNEKEADAASKITVNAENNKLDIRKSGDDKFHISYYVSENYVGEYKEENGEISLRMYLKNKRKFLDYILGYDDREIEILVPDSFAGDILIKTANGEVGYGRAGEIGKLDLTTSNGEVSVTGAKAAEIKIMTSNGKIEVKDSESQTLVAETKNGAITLKNFKGNADLSTKNGSIDADGLTTDRIKAATSNGNINISLIGDASDYAAALQISAGKITYNGVQVAGGNINPGAEKNIDARTSSGNIVITFK
jgi:hypothetical protein